MKRGCIAKQYPQAGEVKKGCSNKKTLRTLLAESAIRSTTRSKGGIPLSSSDFGVSPKLHRDKSPSSLELHRHHLIVQEPLLL